MEWLEPGRAVTWIAVLGVAVAAGCGESTGSTSVTLSGQVTEYVPGSQTQGPPIAGVEVCQFASNNCALTNDAGEYALRLKKNRDVQISHVKEGFGPVLVARRSGIVDLAGGAVLATDAVVSELAAQLETPYPPVGTGFLSMTAYRGPVSDGVTIAGVSYSVTASNGRSFYVDDSGVPVTSLTETQAPGTGGFIELAPTTVDLHVAGAAVNCTSEESWLAEATNTFKLPIRTGFWTQSNISCE